MTLAAYIALLVTSIPVILAKEESCLADAKHVPSSGSAQVQVKAMQSAPCPCDRMSHLYADPNNLVNHTEETGLVATNPDTSPSVLETHRRPCEAFCVDNGCPCLIPWAQRCTIKSCAGCPECDHVNPPVSPPPTPAPPVNPPGPCRNDNTKIDLSKSTMVQNNLAGWGPDAGAQEMRYQSVGMQDGKSLELVVTATDSSNKLGKYRPSAGDGAKNGLSGFFGNINVQGGFSVSLKLEFQDSNKNPVVLPEVHLSILDLDQSGNGRMKEKWQIESRTPMDLVSEGDEIFGEHPTPKLIRLRSTHAGGGCDNPKDPMNLGVIKCSDKPTTPEMTTDQRKRAAMVVVRDVSDFAVKIEATCSLNGEIQTCESGRNYLLTFMSALEDQCH